MAAQSDLIEIGVVDAGVASSDVTTLPVHGPMTIQAYSAVNFDASDVTVQGSIDGIAWSTLGTLNEAVTTNFIAVTSIWAFIKLVCAGNGTAGRELAVKARVYV